MLGILICTVILWSATACGVQVLRWARLLDGGATPRALEWLYGFGLGAVLLGYALLATGLLGHFTRGPIVLVVVAGGLVGCRRWPEMVRAVPVYARRLGRGLSRPTERRPVYMVLVLICVAGLLEALAPPTAYDAISQHLANPRIYLRHGRIAPIHFEHHSNFPSTVEMLFGVGLALGNTDAAQLVHYSFGLLTLLALLMAGRRLMGPNGGAWAAFILVTVPLVRWLLGTAYVDLAAAFFAATAFAAFAAWVGGERHSLWHSALMAGGGMAVKMQALSVFGIMLLLVAASLARRREVPLARRAGQVVGYGLVAAALASPWYVKSEIWMGNPVYPFAYGLFGGRYWGPEEAEQYRQHQLEFGVDEPPSPAERRQMGWPAATFSGPRAPVNLFLALWNVAMRPGEFAEHGLSPEFATTNFSSGPLYLAYVVPLLLFWPRSPGLRWALVACGLLWVSWLVLMQYIRYLLPCLVLAALPAAHAAAAADAAGGVVRLAGRAVAAVWGAAAVLLAVLVLLAGGTWRVALGLTPDDVYLRDTLPVYRASEWLNQVTPPEAKLAVYGEPQWFYLDREYMWADRGHHRLIEYDRLRGGADLRTAYHRLGITHVVVNQQFVQPLFEGDSLPQRGWRQMREAGDLVVVGNCPTAPQYVLMAVR